MSYSLYVKTKPSKLFLKAAIPGGISMLVSSIYMIFDSVFVGKFIGTTAFAALGLAFPFIIVNFALADLIGVGSAVPISIFLGRKEEDKANNFFTCASILIVLTGLLMGLFFYLSAPFLMRFMGADGDLLDLGVRYLRVYAVFSPVTTMCFAVDNFLRISGKIKTSMILNILMSVATVFLELILIKVFDLGITGAALGANISFSAMVFCGLYLFMGGNLQLKFTKPHFYKELIWQIAKNGTPAFLTNVAGRVFSIIMNMVLLKKGGASAVAIYGILMTVAAVVEQILYGVLDSMQPALGYNYGAKEKDRVIIIEKYCLMAGAFVSIGASLVIWAIPKYVAIPFLEDLSLIDMSVHALKLFAFAFIFKWFGQSVQSFFMALEKPVPAMLISVASVFIFPIIIILALYPMELDGLWLNYAITSFLTALLSGGILIRKRNKLFD